MRRARLTRLARRGEETCANADTKDAPLPYQAGTTPPPPARAARSADV